MDAKPTNQAILDAFRSAHVPQTVEDLAEQLGKPVTNIRPRISILLRKGLLSRDAVPWLKINHANRVADITTDSIVIGLNEAFKQGGKDSVAAGRALYDILQGRGQTNLDVQAPNNARVIVLALVRQFHACGAVIVRKAYRRAFPKTLKRTLDDPGIPRTPPPPSFDQPINIYSPDPTLGLLGHGGMDSDQDPNPAGPPVGPDSGDDNP